MSSATPSKLHFFNGNAASKLNLITRVPHSMLFLLPRKFVHMILSYLIPSNAPSHMRSPDGIKEVADLISLGLACHFYFHIVQVPL